MVVTAAAYAANGIVYLSEFPAGQLDWTGSPNKITLVNSMPQIGFAFENALSVSAQSPDAKKAVRLAVEAEVSKLYQQKGESEEERVSQLTARAGLFLIREMASKLK
jgi:NADH dehydrogenase FAD-containing subunit